MTRKDTIMIAVFINAALLIVLFVSAIKNDDGSHVVSASVIEEVRPISLPEPVKSEVKKIKGEEIDQVLKEFSQKKVVAEEKAPQKIDFAKELEAITKAASQPAKAQTAPVKQTNTLQVTVKKGDILDKIAKTHQCSVSDIMKCNNLSSTVLQIGQVLKIPSKGEAKKTPSAHGGEKFYTVKQGDNPWAIAVKNQIKLEELLRLNNLNEEKARKLRAGDKLRIQ